jgi:adenosine deaminase
MRDLRSLPKAHLHLHLEGSIRPETLHDLAQRSGVDVPPIRGFGSFTAFAGMYVAACAVLVTPDAVRRLVHEVIEDAAIDGAVWVEPAVYLPRHRDRIGSPPRMLEIVLDAAARALRARVRDRSRSRLAQRAPRRRAGGSRVGGRRTRCARCRSHPARSALRRRHRVGAAAGRLAGPLLFGPNLLEEYEVVRARLGLDDAALAHIAHCSIDASGAPDELKTRAGAGIDAWSADGRGSSA